jgi:hypothetical protein
MSPAGEGAGGGLDDVNYFLAAFHWYLFFFRNIKKSGRSFDCFFVFFELFIISMTSIFSFNLTLFKKINGVLSTPYPRRRGTVCRILFSDCIPFKIPIIF